MLRILRSSFTIPAGVDQVVDAEIDQSDLEAAVPIGGGITPLAFVFDPEDTDITLKSLVLKNTKTDEGALNLIPDGDAISLEAVNKMVSVESGGVSAGRLTVAHGAKLTGKFDNIAVGAKTIQVLWKVQNDKYGNAPEAVGDAFEKSNMPGAVQSKLADRFGIGGDGPKTDKTDKSDKSDKGGEKTEKTDEKYKKP